MQASFATPRRFLLGLGLGALALGGCTRDRSSTSNAQPTPIAQPQPLPPAPDMAAPSPASAGPGLSGTVVETMDAGGYTYARLARGTTEVWVAGPQTKLAVGTEIESVSGTLMTGFRSETLKRSFDEIYFIGGFGVAGGGSPDRHGELTAGPASKGPHAQGARIEPIAPAAGGHTIAQVFAGKAALGGKPIVVRGKIVKLTSGVLGRNWLHLQDGSGSPGSNDLTITTTRAVPAAIGDIVVARGTLVLDQDFGSGYSYPLLVEQATISAD